MRDRVRSQKAQLLSGDDYQFTLAAWRATEVLRTHEFFEVEDCVHRLWIERPDARPFDDLVEEFSSNGKLLRRGWQAKHVVELKPDVVGPLLLDADGLGLDRVALLVPRDVGRVPGPLRALQDLCEYARGGGSLTDLHAAATQAQRAWLEFAAEVISDPDRLVRSLRRFEVHILDEQVLRDRACAILGRAFEHPEGAFANIRDGARAAAAAQVVLDYAFLEREVLDKLLPSRCTFSPTSRRDARLQVVQRAIQRFDSRRALHEPDLPLLKTLYVSPLLEMTGDGSSSPARPLQEWLEVTPRGVTLQVVADIGAGKSELLIATAADLAARAKADPDAPLPVRVDAVRLHADGAQSTLEKAISPGPARLLSDHQTSWVVLVDGMDEAPSDAWQRLDEVRDWLGDRLHALCVTTRPPGREPNASVRRLRIRAWSAADRHRFLERWAVHEPHAVDAMENRIGPWALDDMLGSPLALTMALLVAHHEPDALSSRTRLFQAATEHLFEQWAHDRRRRTGETERWSEVAPALEPIALDYVRGRGAGITRGQLLDQLRRVSPYAAADLERGVRVTLGVLHADGDVGYRFSLRGVAEYLASGALGDADVDAIVASAGEAWGNQVVRHVIGRAVLAEDFERAAAIVRALLPPASDSRSGRAACRRLMVAVAACCDVSTLPASLVEDVAEAAVARVVEEDSVWEGEVLAACVATGLKSQATPLRDAFLPKAIKLLRDRRGAPAAWFADRELDERKALELLRHRDHGVRLEAVRALGPRAADAKIREVLLRMCLDAVPQALDVRTPAIEAATILRELPRDESFSDLKAPLLRMLKTGSQLTRMAAAVALTPSDVDDARSLVTALASSRGAFDVPAEVLEDLANHPVAGPALESEWPEWRRTLGRKRRPNKGTPDLTVDQPPLSS